MDNVVLVHGQSKCQLLALWQSERAKSRTVFLATSPLSKVDSADVFCQAGFLVTDLGRSSTAQCITEWLSVGWTCLLADFRVPQNQIHIYIRVGHRKWSRAEQPENQPEHLQVYFWFLLWFACVCRCCCRCLCTRNCLIEAICSQLLRKRNSCKASQTFDRESSPT